MLQIDKENETMSEKQLPVVTFGLVGLFPGALLPDRTRP